MSEKFWLGFWKVIATISITLVLSVSGCQVNKQFVLRDMVKAGVDPMIASCSIYNGEVDQVNCVAYYATHK